MCCLEARTSVLTLLDPTSYSHDISRSTTELQRTPKAAAHSDVAPHRSTVRGGQLSAEPPRGCRSTPPWRCGRPVVTTTERGAMWGGGHAVNTPATWRLPSWPRNGQGRLKSGSMKNLIKYAVEFLGVGWGRGTRWRGAWFVGFDLSRVPK